MNAPSRLKIYKVSQDFWRVLYNIKLHKHKVVFLKTALIDLMSVLIGFMLIILCLNMDYTLKAGYLLAFSQSNLDMYLSFSSPMGVPGATMGSIFTPIKTEITCHPPEAVAGRYHPVQFGLFCLA